ncbi:hypothetical protein SLS62_003034 [Diatrype stigma]|uniref:Transmembrane and coiled-coil domain-containing protein 4 n=1 Tax=Diatrype stigma TaxID=117547 RepID=A0AAN9UTH6_9PEZI
MAPLTTEPDHLRVVLNLARRKAYYSLVSEITAYMRSQLELREAEASRETPSNAAASPSAHDPPPYSVRDAPPGTGGDNGGAESVQGRNQRPPRREKYVPPSAALVRLRKAALMHFDSWRVETMGKLKEVVSKADDQAVLDARRKRADMLAARSRDIPADGEDLLLDLGDPTPNPDSKKIQTAQGGSPGSLSSFQNLYHPIPTRLTTIPLEDRQEVLSATMLALLSTGSYSAHSRTLVCYLASALEIPPKFLDGEEAQIATTMVESAQKADEEEIRKKQSGSGMSADAVAAKRRQQGQASRFWKVGLASVAGAALIGVTGGLAAPVVAGAIGGLMGSVGLGGLASFLGIFWMNGALVGTLFGAFGAKMTGEMIDNYAKEVEDFKFLPLADEWGEGLSPTGASSGTGVSSSAASSSVTRRLRVTIGINGWLTSESDVTKPWRTLGDESEVFALRYEMRSLLALGAGLQELVASYAWGTIRAEILRRTVLATLWSALWPIHLVTMAANLDNPFSLARNRSEKAGRVLADALINRVQGERPVTLVGYSLGARVIYTCLRALAEKRAFGLVDNVVLIGAPVPSNPAHWQVMRSVVAGRLFNVYSSNDLILAFLYRATSAQLGIAGLEAINCGGVQEEDEGVINLDLSEEVQGHTRYPDLIARILTRCGFPNVKGGTDEIEKEAVDAGDDHNANTIRLRDRDFAESGNLIDYNEATSPQPSKHTLRELENEKFDPTVKSVLEQKSDAGVREAKIRGSNSKVSAAVTKSMPDLTNSVGSEHPSGSLPPVRATSTGPVPVTNDEDDADNDSEGDIRMVDDDEMEVFEPLAMED